MNHWIKIAHPAGEGALDTDRIIAYYKQDFEPKVTSSPYRLYVRDVVHGWECLGYGPDLKSVRDETFNKIQEAIFRRLEC